MGAYQGPSKCCSTSKAKTKVPRVTRLSHKHTGEQDSQADLWKQIITALQEIFGGVALALTEHCQSNFILFTNVYRLITNVKYRMPEEMQCVSFSHLVQPGALIPPRLLCFTGCNKGDCKQNYHCKTFQLLGEKSRRAVSTSFPTQFSCIKAFIWNNFYKTNLSGV